MKRHENDPVREAVASNIRSYRLALGWSQEKLAERSNLATSMIGSIETHVKFPSTRSLFRLSRALNVEVYELFKLPQGAHKASLERLYDIAALRESLKSDVIEVLNQKFMEYQKSQSSEENQKDDQNQKNEAETGGRAGDKS